MDEAALVAQHAKEQGLDVTITGKGNIYQSMNPYVVDSFVRSISVALVLISILLVFVFGSFKMGMVALTQLHSTPLRRCCVLALGKSIDIGSVLVMSVCLGIAVDDTIHILSNYNRLIRDGLSPQEATAQVLAHESRPYLHDHHLGARLWNPCLRNLRTQHLLWDHDRHHLP